MVGRRSRRPADKVHTVSNRASVGYSNTTDAKLKLGVELMKYIDYVQLNPFQKFWYNLKKFFVNLPSNLGKIFKAIGRFFKKIFVGIGKGFAGYFSRFVKGDWAVKLS